MAMCQWLEKAVPAIYIITNSAKSAWQILKGRHRDEFVSVGPKLAAIESKQKPSF